MKKRFKTGDVWSLQHSDKKIQFTVLENKEITEENAQHELVFVQVEGWEMPTSIPVGIFDLATPVSVKGSTE